MKLITERAMMGNPILEAFVPEEKDKLCKFKATFIQTDALNRNERIYPKMLMESCVQKYMDEKMSPGAVRSMGELNHPEGLDVDLQNASHYITQMVWDANNVVGEAKLMDTPNGRIADAILREGLALGVSTRGLGELGSIPNHQLYSQYPGQIVTEYELVCVDIVADPSAPEGWINGILESKDYIIQGNTPIERRIEKTEKAYKNLEKTLEIMPKKHVQEHLFEKLKEFLGKV